jgi:hypothetical protein
MLDKMKPGMAADREDFMKLTLEYLENWVERYFQAWQSNNPDDIAALFSEQAVYEYGPFSTPSYGREAIVASWIANPDAQEDVRYTCEAVAVQGNTGVAHWHVSYRTAGEAQTRTEMDGILLLEFDQDLRCSLHREWYMKRRD